MATFYLDYEGGSDAADGTTFANRWKTFTNGATAARIAPGDTIRVMASPDPTSLGQTATWTDAPISSTTAIISSTNATPIVLTASAGHGVVTGDTVIVNGHTTNTNANGVWAVTVSGNAITLLNADGSNSVGNGTGGAAGTVRRITCAIVKLTTAVTQNIAVCGNSKTNWTASANVTTSLITTDFKEGYSSQQVSPAAGFTTGLAAYFATGTLDLSAYQQVSFWIKQISGTIGAASSISLALCSDTVGATPVNTINIPSVGALGTWVQVTINTGGALGASIQSIAFYVNTDNGAQNFYIDNVIACKASSSADSLTLSSLISKDPGDHSYGDTYEPWWGIQSINGTRIVLEGGGTNIIPAASPPRGYAGTTETVTTYKREAIKTVIATASNSQTNVINDSGTTGSLITFSGGWNRTDMSTQTGNTWFDGLNSYGYGIYQSSKSFISLDRLNGVRYSSFYQQTGSTDADCVIGRMQAANCLNSGFGLGGPRLTAETLSVIACAALQLATNATVTTIGRASSNAGGGGFTPSAGGRVTTVVQASNNGSNGVSSQTNSYIGSVLMAHANASNGYIVSSSRCVVGSVVANNNGNSGIQFSSDGGYVLGGSTSGNVSGGVTSSIAQGYLKNFTINEATEFATPTAFFDGRVYSENHDGVAGSVVVFCDGGRITRQTSIVHGSATAAWQFAPTSTNRSVTYPLNLPIAQIAVGASTLVTVKAWFRRDNTGLTARLMCKGGQISGVSADVSASMTAAANTWEELTITFTPSEAGVIEIEAQFYGGTTYNGYVSDATITQA